MTPQEILQHWLKYSNYDPNQTRFNLLSTDWHFNHIGKNIAQILKFDPSGVVGILYAKDCFLNLCKDVKVSVFNLLSAPAVLEEDKEMWDIFMSEDVQQIEERFLSAINAVVEQTVHVKQIGERDPEKEKAALFSSITSVTEQLTRCKTDLFLRGGPILPIKNFSTKIHIFERLSECLLAIEKAVDGMYLCYVNCGGTADGYFGFYIKSNGTILSVSERIDEEYPGQHKNCRNGHWSEEKQYELFPYNYIFTFSELDYKGYAHKHSIDDSKLEYCQLEAGAYMPLILAMVMLANKFENIDVSDMPLMLVDSLFRRNLETALPGTTALAVCSNSAIALPSMDFVPPISTEDVLSDETRVRLTDENRPWNERGVFPKEENIFVELYSDGFELDSSKLLVSDPELKLLPAELRETTDLTPNAEFVGTAGRMELISYMQAREQLAEYVRTQMAIEYNRFGGAKAAAEWLLRSTLENKDYLFRLCVRKYYEVQAGIGGVKVSSLEWANSYDAPGLRFVYYYLDIPGGCPKGTSWYPFPFNECKESKSRWSNLDINKKLCPITGSLASITFFFRPDFWEEIEQLFGPVPKVFKGWVRRGHLDYGNPILSVTDPCSGIGNLFENSEQQCNPRVYHPVSWESTKKPPYDDCEIISDNPMTEFSFGISFSKRGFAKLLKMYADEKNVADSFDIEMAKQAAGTQLEPALVEDNSKPRHPIYACCPACFGKEHVVRTRKVLLGGTHIVVACPNCGYETDHFETRNEARECWNSAAESALKKKNTGIPE